MPPAIEYPDVAPAGSPGLEGRVAQDPVAGEAVSEIRMRVEPPEPVSALAHRTIETILDVVGRFSSVQRTVTLRFAVGGSDLRVSISLHAEEVHATFATESVALREALAWEWQALQAGPAERGLRLAEPVFASLADGRDSPDAREREPGHADGGKSPLPERRGAPSPRSGAAAVPPEVAPFVPSNPGRLYVRA